MISLNWDKLDKFYIVFILIVVLMSILIIISFRAVFSAYLSAYDVSIKGENELKVDRDKLNEAYSWATKKETLPLEVRD